MSQLETETHDPSRESHPRPNLGGPAKPRGAWPFQSTHWPAIIASVFAFKAVLFIFGGQAHQTLENKKLGSVFEWLQIWYRWDTNAYIRLAESGYRFSDQLKADMMFYPLYPWTIRVAEMLIGDYFLGALLISTIASIVLAILFFELVKLEYSARIAFLAVWFFFIFPTGYFLHIGYSESLFLMFAVGSVLACRKGNWMLAGLLGACACMSRANGLILVAALSVEALHQYWLARKFDFRWLWIGVIPVGFAVYLGVNYSASGDPFAFFGIRRRFFHMAMAPPWVGVEAAFGQAHWGSEMVGMQELLFLMLGAACSVWSWFKLRPIYSAWITCSWLLAASVTFCQSIPRYTLAMFPIFILFALAGRRQFWLVVISFWSLLYFGLFASQFVWGRWAF